MKIKIIVDNKTYSKKLSQHGLSLLIEHSNRKILFDTGQSEYVLKNNLDNEDLDIDMIVISHGHYDHSDGLEYFIKKEDFNIPIYIHNKAFAERFYNNRYIGIKKSIIDFLKNYENLITVEKPYQLNNGIVISGTVDRTHYYEKDDFYKKDEEGNLVKDIVIDDMFIIVDGVIITGCSHSGIINVVEYAKKIYNKEIKGIIGGFHLMNVSKDYIDKIYNYLKDNNLDIIMPLHCVGFNELKVLSNLEGFEEGYVGKEIVI